MLIIKELIYFMFTLFLLCVLICLIIWCGWVINNLCIELLDMDIIAITKTIVKEKKEKKEKKK